MNLEYYVALEYMKKYNLNTQNIEKNYIYRRLTNNQYITIYPSLSKTVLSNLTIKEIYDTLIYKTIPNYLELKIYTILISYYQKTKINFNPHHLAQTIINTDFDELISTSLKKETKFASYISQIPIHTITLFNILACTNFFNKILYYYDKEVINLDQNPTSLQLLLENIYYPNNQTHFWLTLLNYFQDLSLNEIYRVNSQAATTKILKELRNKNIIKIVNNPYEHIEKNDLQEYMTTFNSKTNIKKRKMYITEFIKLKDIDSQQMTSILSSLPSINLNDIQIISKNQKVYCHLKLEAIIAKIKSPLFKNDLKTTINELKRIISSISTDLHEEIAWQEDKFNLKLYVKKRQ